MHNCSLIIALGTYCSFPVVNAQLFSVQRKETHCFFALLFSAQRRNKLFLSSSQCTTVLYEITALGTYCSFIVVNSQLFSVQKEETNCSFALLFSVHWEETDCFYLLNAQLFSLHRIQIVSSLAIENGWYISSLNREEIVSSLSTGKRLFYPCAQRMADLFLLCKE